jgi:hypothetical protein
MMSEEQDLKNVLSKGFLDLKIAVESTNPDPARTIQGYRDMRAAQQRAADQLVVATDALVRATRRLGIATWMLVALTALTAITAIAELASIFVRGGR